LVRILLAAPLPAKQKEDEEGEDCQDCETCDNTTNYRAGAGKERERTAYRQEAREILGF
jgi:hypothetical protein